MSALANWIRANWVTVSLPTIAAVLGGSTVYSSAVTRTQHIVVTVQGGLSCPGTHG